MWLRRVVACTLALLLLIFVALGLDMPGLLHAAPAEAPLQQESGLSMQMYVTTVNNGCDAAVASPEESTSLTVKRGTTLYYCFHLANDTDTVSQPLTLTNHILADGSATNVRATFAHTMLPGDTVNTWEAPPSLVVSEVAETSGVETGIWVATDSDTNQQRQTSAFVNLTVVDPVVVAALTVSRNSSECGTLSTMSVPTGSTGVSLCISLTNQGDVPLTTHQLALSGGINWTGSISRAIAPGATLRIPASDVGEFNLPSLTLPTVNAATNVQLTATSSESDGLSSTSTATANIGVGSANMQFNAVVRANPITRLSECPRTSGNITVVRDTPVYYCMHLSNTGSVPLTLHHLRSITPSINITFAYDLQPSTTLVLTNGTLAALGQPMVLGPITATNNLASSFGLTSTNAAGFNVALSASLLVSAADPTATPTETPSETPALPTSTPTITPTPVPSDTPVPTMTPTMTPMPPTPTWTRSFALSGLQTPTPQAAAAAEQATATVNFLETAIARATFDTQATANAAAGLPPPQEVAQPESPLSPLELPADPLAQAAAEATMTAVAIIAGGGALAPESPEQVAMPVSPLDTPTEPPSPAEISAGIPTEIPAETPTVTPTPTQRPVVYPTPLPPADLTTVFTQVLGSSAATTGFIFLLTGTIVFFGVAGGMVAYGFLRNSRRRYEVYEIEGDDGNDPSVPPQTQRSAQQSKTGSENWPSSLP